MDDKIQIKDLDQGTPGASDWAVFQKATSPFEVEKCLKSELEGHDAYVYIAYADDDSGTGFTLTFNSSKDYIAILSTDTEIPSPVVGDFAGLWKNYKGQIGNTGNAATIQVGATTTLNPGESATVTNSGDEHAATFNFGIPEGEKGDQGDTGNGIVSVVKTGTVGLVDTYTITFDDASTTTFDVTNGLDITWLGAYNNGTTYVLNDAISYLGSSYVCILESTGNVPTNVTYWQLLARKGADGEGSGDVMGPASSVDENIALFDGITGKLLKDGLMKLSDLEPALPTTPADPQNKFLNGNKLWSEILVGSGGYAANLYLTTVDSTDVAGYEQVSYTNDVAETTISQTVNASEELMVAYLFEQAIATTTIDAGAWRMSLFGAIDAAAGDSWFKFEVFVRHTDTTETVLFSQYSGLIENRVGYEGYQRITIESVQPLFTVLSTDRLGIKIYAKTTATGDRTLSYVVGDRNASYINTPLALRHNQLRGLNDDTNYLHVTSTEKSTWNGKQNALGYTPEDVANKRTSFQITPDDTHYPSEKLVKDSLDAKAPLASPIFTGTVTLGDNARIDLTLPTADTYCTGNTTDSFASGYSSAVGDLVFFGSSGKWLEVDADAVATCNGLIGIALEAKTDGQAMLVALPGSFVRLDSWNWTVGATLYAGETPGTMQNTIPTGADAIIKVVGFAVSADVIYFNPSPDQQSTVA